MVNDHNNDEADDDDCYCEILLKITLVFGLNHYGRLSHF